MGRPVSAVPSLCEPRASGLCRGGSQDAASTEAQKLPTAAECVSPPRRQLEARGPPTKGCSPHPLLFSPHRCALLPTPLPRPPTSLMPSPCFPVSRLPRAFTVVAVVAQWPPRPRPPRRTSPTPPPAASRPRAGQLRPRPQGGHSTTSRSSRPCGLRHLPPQRQTGHPWPPSRPLQNQGPTLPWRPRDKGGPSPLPEARTLWGGGEDVSVGPLHPPLSAPPVPWSPGGERLDPGASTQAARAQTWTRRHGAPTLHGFGSELSWCWWTELQRTSSLPQRTCSACPSPGGCGESPQQRRLGWLLPWSSLGASRPRSPPLGMQSLLRMCVCSCVCIYMYVALQEAT